VAFDLRERGRKHGVAGENDADAGRWDRSAGKYSSSIFKWCINVIWGRNFTVRLLEFYWPQFIWVCAIWIFNLLRSNFVVNPIF
jgi:hypothetical protein